MTLRGVPLYRYAGDHAKGDAQRRWHRKLRTARGTQSTQRRRPAPPRPSLPPPLWHPRCLPRARRCRRVLQLRAQRRRRARRLRTSIRPTSERSVGTSARPSAGARASVVGQPLEQRRAPGISTRCSAGERSSAIAPRQPALALAAVGLQRLQPLLGQLDERAPPVGRGRRGARSARRPRGRRSSGSSTAGARARRSPGRRSTSRPRDPGARARRPGRARSDARRAAGARGGRAPGAARWRASSCPRPLPRSELYPEAQANCSVFLYN